MSPTVCLEDLFRNRKCMTSSPQTTFNPTSQESPLTLDLDVYHSWASSVFSLPSKTTSCLRGDHLLQCFSFPNASILKVEHKCYLLHEALAETQCSCCPPRGDLLF